MTRICFSFIRAFLDRKIGDLNNEPFSDILERDLEKVNKCLSALKNAAKKDLSLKSTKWRR